MDYVQIKKEKERKKIRQIAHGNREKQNENPAFHRNMFKQNIFHTVALKSSM